MYLYLEHGSRKRWFVFANLALSVILSRGILTEIIRYFLPRPRPFEIMEINPLFSENLQNAFPSGHASFLFALGTTLWFFNRRWGTYYIVLAFIVGAARVFAGVHWPVDILGGAAIGIISALLIYTLLSPYSPFRERPAQYQNKEND